MIFKQLDCKFWFIVKCHTSLELFLSKMEVKACNCLTREEKKLILANYEEGELYFEIADIVRRSKIVVYRVNSRFKADKTLETKLRTGRSPMTTKREDRMIVKKSFKDHFNTATSISCAFCEQTGKPTSIKTVSRWLNKEKLVAWILCRKPLISK